MKQNLDNISGVHKFLRSSKFLFLARKAYSVLLGIIRYGFFHEMRWVKSKIASRIAQRQYYKKLILSDSERELQKQKTYADKICFSILVPLYNTPEPFLREMIESVQKQTYSDWQLCLADGSDAQHREVGEIVREYAEGDSRICYEPLERNGGISENTNACIRMAEGEYILLFDHDDLLHESALFELRRAVDEEGADFIYTDEAVFSKNYRRPDSYHFKPDFAPDDLRSNNYICHITCFQRKLLDKLGEGFRKEYDGSQDFDLVLRLTEQAERIVHIPKVLYFWRCHALSVASDISAKTYCIDAGRKAVGSHLERENIEADVCSSEAYPVIYRITYRVKGNPKVSIILWEDEKKKNTEHCIESIRKNTGYANYEILPCSRDSGRNDIARRAGGDYLLFLDGGCLCREEDWLAELLGIAQREEVGAVSGKILYANDIIRDAGIILGQDMGVGKNQPAVSSFFRLNGDNVGYLGKLYFIHNVSAVSDSCLLVRKENFLEAGGFDEQLPSWFAGLDFSLKLREMGKINVVNPYARLWYVHKDRKRDMTGNYIDKESYNEILKNRWRERLAKEDPYYNLNLSKKSSDYTMG